MGREGGIEFFQSMYIKVNTYRLWVQYTARVGFHLVESFDSLVGSWYLEVLDPADKMDDYGTNQQELDPLSAYLRVSKNKYGKLKTTFWL